MRDHDRSPHDATDERHRRSTGPDQAGRGTAPTAGHDSRHEDAALGLGGTPHDAAPTDIAPRGDERALREEGETGLEIGEATLGSSANAAERVDTFNVPGQGADEETAGR